MHVVISVHNHLLVFLGRIALTRFKPPMASFAPKLRPFGAVGVGEVNLQRNHSPTGFSTSCCNLPFMRCNTRLRKSKLKSRILFPH